MPLYQWWALFYSIVHMLLFLQRMILLHDHKMLHKDFYSTVWTVSFLFGNSFWQRPYVELAFTFPACHLYLTNASLAFGLLLLQCDYLSWLLCLCLPLCCSIQEQQVWGASPRTANETRSTVCGVPSLASLILYQRPNQRDNFLQQPASEHHCELFCFLLFFSGLVKNTRNYVLFLCL